MKNLYFFIVLTLLPIQVLALRPLEPEKVGVGAYLGVPSVINPSVRADYPNFSIRLSGIYAGDEWINGYAFAIFKPIVANQQLFILYGESQKKHHDKNRFTALGYAWKWKSLCLETGLQYVDLYDHSSRKFGFLFQIGYQYTFHLH